MNIFFLFHRFTFSLFLFLFIFTFFECEVQACLDILLLCLFTIIVVVIDIHKAKWKWEIKRESERKKFFQRSFAVSQVQLIIFYFIMMMTHIHTCVCTQFIVFCDYVCCGCKSRIAWKLKFISHFESRNVTFLLMNSLMNGIGCEERQQKRKRNEI